MEKIIQQFFEGNTLEAYKLFGVHKAKKGYSFTVYAPNACSVGVGEHQSICEVHKGLQIYGCIK